MLWIGLTGGLGTGKSTVASLLRRMGFSVVDADLIAHQVLMPGQKAYQEVVQYFGREVLQLDQSIGKEIDRAKLAKLVFQDSEKLKKLEAIIHPEVKRRVQVEKEKLITNNEKLAFYDVPLLFEKKLQSDFDKSVVVATSSQLQRDRLKSRNNWSDPEIDSRLRAQIPLIDKIKLADFVIHNEGTLTDLEHEVQKFIDSVGKSQ